MEALEFYKALKRMCDENIGCQDCPLDQKCRPSVKVDPEEVVEIVEEWVKEYPIKTRKTEFLKMFPNADMEVIMPCDLDKTLVKPHCNDNCDICIHDFWNEEVSE